MKYFICLLFFFQISMSSLMAQELGLDYYLPENMAYNEDIPTPKDVLGYEVGEWHVGHDQLVMYMKILAERSDRVTIHEYARSYENRPLIYLTITSKRNQDNIDDIQKEHIAFVNGESSKKAKNQPVVVLLGHTVHGNEASGANSALLTAYHLVASDSKEVKALLDNTIVLLDPCFNPDGMNRFANWVNGNKSTTRNPDNNHREYNEGWPRGRTNHYWFDLNRDWLPVQHPESQGRIKMFHEWKPNVLTDAHEMGTNSTYFFQPGIPSRNNPLTPQHNFDLTHQLAEYHAHALDSIGSLYYSQESFDDFYVGKGSTYPDINACVGILFEQASSRGHIQHSDNGVITFPFTIRNHFNTALSTLKGAYTLQEELLEYQQRFFKTALQEAQKDNAAAYVFGDEKDKSKTVELIKILDMHEIEVYPLKKDYKGKKHNYSEKSGFVVPMYQPQYRLIKAMFEQRTSFKDSLFYDVSAWTLPLAFNLPFETTDFSIKSYYDADEAIDADIDLSVDLDFGEGLFVVEDKVYALAIEWNDYYTPKLLYKLLEEEIIVKVATATFSSQLKDGIKQFERGTLVVPMGIQRDKKKQIVDIIQKHIAEHHSSIYRLKTGLTVDGIDLGSPKMKVLSLPKVGLVVGDGVNAYEAGEVWHLLDQRYELPISLLELNRLESFDLNEYNVLVLVSGSYGNIRQPKLRDWLKNGGVLITQKTASTWIASTEMCGLQKKDGPVFNARQSSYEHLSAQKGAEYIGGAIFEVEADLSHPLLYGYTQNKLPVFRNHTIFFNEPKNKFAMPLHYTKSNPLMAGYISKKNLAALQTTPALMVSVFGTGRVVAFADNPNFRAFWFGTNRLFMNAIFFGGLIAKGSAE